MEGGTEQCPEEPTHQERPVWGFQEQESFIVQIY